MTGASGKPADPGTYVGQIVFNAAGDSTGDGNSWLSVIENVSFGGDGGPDGGADGGADGDADGAADGGADGGADHDEPEGRS